MLYSSGGCRSLGQGNNMVAFFLVSGIFQLCAHTVEGVKELCGVSCGALVLFTWVPLS